jgi:4-diphosphocytidyl-2-C-methyl-D-erythritol kinase
LCRLWQLDLSAALRELSLGLGADLPVCIYGRSARLRGAGERLDPVRGLPELPLVLVNPGRPLPTGRVFAALAPSARRSGREQGMPPHPSLAQLIVWLKTTRNELEPAAERLEPAVTEVLGMLRQDRDCELARMSGSGATCFGIYRSERDAIAAAARLAASRPGWWVTATMVRP